MKNPKEPLFLAGIYRIRFNTPPTTRVLVIITSVAYPLYFIPSSFKNTTKVAIQGKYMVNATEAIISCLSDSPKGASIPTATSLRKNPMIMAPTAS